MIISDTILCHLRPMWFSQSDIRAIISAPYLFGVVTFVLFAVAPQINMATFCLRAAWRHADYENWENANRFTFKKYFIYGEQHWEIKLPLEKKLTSYIRVNARLISSHYLSVHWYQWEYGDYHLKIISNFETYTGGKGLKDIYNDDWN